ncbi:MAG: hypothetical protein HY814_01535 [Candidatus Riflebacteria bacterium]|nr:hypothetical protein [Candidatus Riflebacteria bacterium]
MDCGRRTRLIDAAIGLVLAAMLVVLMTTITGPCFWSAGDALFYEDMARYGTGGTEWHVAPFAYRPATPWLAGSLAWLGELPVARAFQLLARASSGALLVLVFLIARHLGAPRGVAGVTLLLTGLGYWHVRFPIFFSSLVDVEAYVVMLLAWAALLGRRHGLALVGCGAGLFFKEFLIVPSVILLLRLARQYRKERTLRAGAAALGAALVLAGCLAYPRLTVTVVDSWQSIDPVNKPQSISRLLEDPANPRRMLNVVFATAGYLLPTLMLLTRERARLAWAELRTPDNEGLLFCALVFGLTVYGGTNIPIFASYLLPVQTVLLARMLSAGPSRGELVICLAGQALFNNVLFQIPEPSAGVGPYLDFWGFYDHRVTPCTTIRIAKMIACVMACRLVRELDRLRRMRQGGQSAGAADGVS